MEFTTRILHPKNLSSRCQCTKTEERKKGNHEVPTLSLDSEISPLLPA